MHSTKFHAAAITLLLVTTAQAEKNSAIAPKIGSLGSAIFETSFDTVISDPFKAVKGEWGVTDGALVGKELAADKHAAVLNLQKKNRDSVIRFSFKCEGKTNGLQLSLNHKGGHLFRVAVAGNSVSITLDKDKKDPKSKAMKMATATGKFEKGKWYTMQVEMKGDRVVAQTDNGLSLEATHEKLDTDKPNYRFVMRGSSVAIDDVSIWNVE